MPTRKKGYRFRAILEKILYTPLLYLINFFIFIGEAVRLILSLPVNTIVSLQKALFSIFQFTAKTIAKLQSPVQEKKKKLIVKPKKTVRKFTFPKAISSFLVTFGYNIEKAFLRIVRNARSIRLPKLPTIRFKKKRKLSVFAQRLRYFAFGFLAAVLVVSTYNSYAFVKSLPSPKNIGKVNYSLTTHLYDRNGKVLYEVFRDQNRTPIRFATLPKYISNGTIAIEDKDFFRHNGISPIGGMIRALKENIINKEFQGGSTITQQLVKSSLLSPERTIERKIKEIILALWTEQLYSKQEILEMYLNQVPYGGSAYGIEEASKIYFNKHAHELTIAEAAFLAGLPQAPTLYSPYVNPRLSLARRNDVLKKMFEQKYITENQYRHEVQQPLSVTPPRTAIRAPHFVFYAKNELIKQFGIRSVEEGGLRVVTTLDLNIQQKAEEILKEELAKIKNLNVGNGGILITRPQNGEILAMVGSEDYFATSSGAFNVTTALRQPGSSIKPLMYSLALERGDYTAATMLSDSPVVFTSVGGPSYRPVNYDGKFHGVIPLRFALANSYNVPAVKVLNTLGVSDFVEHAKRMGISTWNDSSRFGLSLTLGGGEVTMIDMAKAFGAFANTGNRTEVTPLMKVKNISDETVLDQFPQSQRVLSPGISYIISDILSDNDARKQAFGARSALEIPGYKVAVKTGTTDDKKDNWTIGYTPEFVVVVWVGNNDNTPMHPFLTSGITGAAPIWNKVMTYLLEYHGHKNSWFSQPDDIIAKDCYGGKKEYFLTETQNKVACGRSFNLTPSPTKQSN